MSFRKKNKVLMVVFNFFTHDSRVLKEALSLKNNGYEPHICALYRDGLKKKDIVHDIPVTRLKFYSKVFLPKGHIRGLILRIEIAMQILFKFRGYRYIHCHELAPLPYAVLYKIISFFYVKLIYDAHEYETEQGATGLKYHLAKLSERFFIRFANAVITVSDSIALEYQRLYGIAKPIVLFNTPPYQKVRRRDYFRAHFGLSGNALVFLYQGGLAPSRGIEILLDTFASLGKGSNKFLVLMGYGPLEDLVKDYASRYGNIKFHPAVPPSELLSYTASADVGIAFIENTCLSYYYCLPNKLFEYLMAGLPVLVSDLYELRRFVTDYDIGVVAPSNDLTGFRTALGLFSSKRVAHWRKNTRQIIKEYNWEIQEKKLLAIYQSLEKQIK